MKTNKHNESLISREQRKNYWLYGCYLSLILSGFITWLWPVHSIFNQWLTLIHSATGLLFVLVLVSFTLIHFRRTLGLRKAGSMLSGIFLIALFGYLCYTGLRIIWLGRLESEGQILNNHIVVACASILILIAHGLTHIYYFPKRRRESKDQDSVENHKENQKETASAQTKISTNYFPSLPSQLKTLPMLSALYALGVSLSLTLLYAAVYENNPTAAPAVAAYQYYDKDKHPFRPSQTETESTAFIHQSFIAGSENCADCHRDIADQWYSSMHKQAASDPAYVTNISLLANTKGMVATRYCEGCHAPVALLTGQLSPGGTHGGVAGTTAFNEGISCLSCHNISKAVHLKGVASYQYSPHRPYLFYGSQNPMLKMIHHYLVRVKPQQHKQDMGRDILSSPELCATCHVQFMDEGMNNWGWVKMQDEYTAWLQSPFSNQTHHSFADQNFTRCHDCHMPLVSGEDPSADQSGNVRAHHFPGANTMMPTLNGDTKQLQATIKFLQSNKMRVSIEPPHRKDATQSGQYIDESLRATTETPAYFYLNESAEIRVVVTNSGVGHNFPGGTVDINQAWLELLVTDAKGELIYHSGFVQEDKTIDPKAYFYRSQPIDRFGNEIWQHDLFNRVGETYKNVIPPGESDLVTYNFSVPPWVQSPLTITAVLKYRKFNQRYAKWALGAKYRELPIVDVARHSLLVPIREQPPVINSLP